MKYLQQMTNHFLKGACLGSRDLYFKFWSYSHIFGIDKARHFKFRTLTAEEYYCMHDRLLLKGMIVFMITGRL